MMGLSVLGEERTWRWRRQRRQERQETGRPVEINDAIVVDVVQVQRAVVVVVVPVGLRRQEAAKDPGRRVFEPGVEGQKDGRVDEGVGETDVQGHLVPGWILRWADGCQTPPFFR